MEAIDSQGKIPLFFKKIRINNQINRKELSMLSSLWKSRAGSTSVKSSESDTLSVTMLKWKVIKIVASYVEIF